MWIKEKGTTSERLPPFLSFDFPDLGPEGLMACSSQLLFTGLCSVQGSGSKTIERLSGGSCPKALVGTGHTDRAPGS